MKKYSIIILTLMLLSLTGCEDSNGLIGEQEEIVSLNEEINELKETIASQEEQLASDEQFSYLTDFTDQELHAYDLFLKRDRDISHLKDFSPEKVNLLYYHSFAIDDLETIYAITYDGGSLPEYDSFKEKFYSTDFSHQENQAALSYRYYDDILIREEQTDEKCSVEINISYGTYQSARIMALRKENNQWKIELQHLL